MRDLIYIDDFEGTTSSIDLRFPFVSWALASTPQGNGLFPEATLTNNLTMERTGLNLHGIILSQLFRINQVLTIHLKMILLL